MTKIYVESKSTIIQLTGLSEVNFKAGCHKYVNGGRFSCDRFKIPG